MVFHSIRPTQLDDNRFSYSYLAGSVKDGFANY
jgi:hypothetical protein